MKKQNENLKVFTLPFFPGVEAISGSHINNDFRRHIHKTYIIGIVEQGIRIINFTDAVSRVAENEVFFMNPGQVHSCSSESLAGHSYKVLSVSSEIMRSIASQMSEKHEKSPWFKTNHSKNNGLWEKMVRLFRIIETPESDIQVESSIYSFLSFLLTDFSESPPLVYITGKQKDSIKRVCDYIGQHFSDNLSLKKLAGIACLSPFHFQREFKKCMGITPHEYLNDFRISESKKMLLKSKDIADIANQLGFSDQSHFSRIFRKTVGIPPGKYCKTNQI